MTWFREYNPLMQRQWINVRDNIETQFSDGNQLSLAIDDRISWCEENCRARWSHSYVRLAYEGPGSRNYGTVFFFRNKQDAMLYKLTFVGT